MDIGFVVMGHPDPHNTKWFPAKIVYTKNQIEAAYNRHQLSVVSPDMFYTLQGLKYNDAFKKYISLWRKELGISKNGLSHARYLKIAKEYVNFAPQTEEEVYVDPKYGNRLFSLGQKYRHILRMHHYLTISGFAGYNNWELLVLYGLIEPVLDESITWQLRNFEDMYSSAQFNPFGTITINLHRRVTRNQIVKYINQHFEEIEKTMNLNLLPALPKSKVFISEEDLKILDLKSKGLKDGQILDRLAQVYDEQLKKGEITEKDIPESQNEEAFRMAYLRLKGRVNTLFREVKE